MTPAGRARRRWSALPRWARALGWAALAVAVAVGAVVLWVVAMLSGGFDDLLDVSQPDPTSREVVQARQGAERDLERDLGGLSAGSDLVSSGITGVGHDCQRGQHNWKIDDPFDLSCRTRRAVVLLVPQRAPAAALRPLLARLEESGFAPLHPSAALDLAELPLGDGGALLDGRYRAGSRAALLSVVRAPEVLPSYPTLALERDGGPVPRERALAGLAPGQVAVLVVLEDTYYEE